MTRRILVLMVVGGLSACGGSQDADSNPLADGLALPKTSTMPTGNARYVGTYTRAQSSDDSAGGAVDRWRETSTADFAMTAQFDTRTVTAELTNLIVAGQYEVSTPTTSVIVDPYYTQFSGKSSGSGDIFISDGAVQFSADLTGAFTASRVGTSAQDAVAATGDAIFVIDDPITLAGTFRGSNAEAVYGKQTQSTGTGSSTATLVAVQP